MVKKVTFVGFRGGDRPNRPPWIRVSLDVKRINTLISNGTQLCKELSIITRW